MPRRNPSPIDRAKPVLRKPKRTDVQKVQVTRTTTEGMQASANWGAAVDVQTAVKVWNEASDALEANAELIAWHRGQLALAEHKQRQHRRSWRAATQQVLGAVAVFCSGSVDAVLGFCLDVLTHRAIAPFAAPEGLVVSSGTQAGDVVARWANGGVWHGFFVQHATDPADPTTYAAPAPCTRTTFTLGGAPPGSTVHFRVAAVDPRSESGLSPWSAWAAGTVR